MAADAAAGQEQGAANAAAAPAAEEPEAGAGGGYAAEAEQQMQTVAAAIAAVAAEATAAADGVEPESPSRRTRGGLPRAPPIRFSGNHIVKPLRLRHQDTDQQRIRKKVWSRAYEQPN